MDKPGHSYYNPKLLKCIKSAPRLLGCEAAYYFPTDIDVCTREKSREGGRRELLTTRTAGHGGRRRRITDDENDEGSGKETNVEDSRRGTDGEERSEDDGAFGDGGDDEKGAGKLVLHVRSGDIFDNDILSYYGQVSQGRKPGFGTRLVS